MPASLPRYPWCAARDGPLWGWYGVCRPPLNRTLAPPGEAKVPGVSLPGGRLYRQMKVIAKGGMMETVAAILIAAGAAALVILGLIFVVGAAWFALSSR
jgi:hypothetical protein